MKQALYKDIRDQMKTGDLMGFEGEGLISSLIKVVTGSHISHVGTILTSMIDGNGLVQIIESTSLDDGFSGVKINRMADHVRDYEGKIWWYPLKSELREKADMSAFTKFVLEMNGREYDTPQAIFSAINFIPDQDEDFGKLFCSEMVSQAYEEAGVIPPVNASEMTPADVVAFDIYDEPCLIT